MTSAVRRIHFVGVGGAGMSGIAEILHDQGHAVSGSDASDSETLRRLASRGLRVHVGHRAEQLREAELVVVSTAIAADNPELAAARSRGITIVSRAAMLAELMRGKRGIAIAGTHGKTTTTSLVASVLIEAGLAPTFVIGGTLASVGTNARLGQGDLLVAEADESDASFLQLEPQMAVVTNIDADHMDTYGQSLDRLDEAFVAFLHRLPPNGRAVVCGDDAGVRRIAARVERPLLRYGLDQGCLPRALDVVALPGARMRFTAAREGSLPELAVELNLAGVHNVRNALAAIAVADALVVPGEVTARALANFGGVGRRFTRHGEVAATGGGSFTLVDDYGHHPVEMAAVIAAARGAFPRRRLVLAFQPHRHSRTRDCFDDFVRVLGQADQALLADIYAAGEAAIEGVTAATLAQRVEGARHVGAIGAMAAAIRDTARSGDVVITMGAGSIAEVPAQLKGGAA